jgi:hypothetical protein
MRAALFTTALSIWVVSFSSGGALAGPPAGLLGKSVVVSYGYHIPGKAADGSRNSGGMAVSVTIYVSSAGRIFAKSDANLGGYGSSNSMDPNAGNFHFEGSSLVGVLHKKTDTTAVQIRASFDGAFQSCTVKAKSMVEAGVERTWIGMDGRKFTADGPPVISAESCSIRAGNSFAN